MLVAFDFDGTVSESDPYALLAEEAGVPGEVTAISERARTGETGLAESLRQRVAHLGGLPEIEVEAAFERISLRNGAADLIARLQRGGHHLVVITAAPARGVELAFDAAGVEVDTIVAPRLGIENNALSGEIEGRILEQSKGEILGGICVETETPPGETLAIGSTTADRSMLEVADDSVCFSPVGDLEQHCEETVSTMSDLHDLLEGRNVLGRP